MFSKNRKEVYETYKRLLLTAFLVAPWSAFSTITTNQAIKLADTAYKRYVGSVVQAHKGSAAGLKKMTKLRESREMQELKKLLDRALDTGVMAEPMLLFAECLQAKLGDTKRIIKDFALTDQELIDQICVAAINKVSYFEALKFFGLQHAYLYTLGILTEEQKEIAEYATQVVSFMHDSVALSGNIEDLSAVEGRLAILKASPLLQKMHQEVITANGLAQSWAEGERAVPITRFFLHLVELKVTNKAEIVKKYGITDPERLAFVDWLIAGLDMQKITDALGFL